MWWHPSSLSPPPPPLLLQWPQGNTVPSHLPHDNLPVPHQLGNLGPLTCAAVPLGPNFPTDIPPAQLVISATPWWAQLFPSPVRGGDMTLNTCEGYNGLFSPHSKQAKVDFLEWGLLLTPSFRRLEDGHWSSLEAGLKPSLLTTSTRWSAKPPL